MDDLLACPFCGVLPSFRRYMQVQHPENDCILSDMAFTDSATETEAGHAWNRRAALANVEQRTVRRFVAGMKINEIPTEVLRAANTVIQHAKLNGWEDWELSGVADRDLVYKLRVEIEKHQIIQTNVDLASDENR